MALLANVSVSWYTSLEQGRDVNPSPQVLEGIAGALELSAQETRHLFVLAGRAPRGVPGSPGRASPTLRRVMYDLKTTPAYAMTARGDLAYRNPAADVAFSLSSPFPPPHERNVVWRLFVDPASRGLYEDWETTARAVLARLRADFAANLGDPKFEALVEDLKSASAEFRELWSRHDVTGASDVRKVVVHPEVGRLVLEHTTLHSPADPDLRVLVYVPSTGEDLARLKELMAKTNGSAWTSQTGRAWSATDHPGLGNPVW